MPDLVRIDTVCRGENEDYEGAIGLVIDTDIDWNGNGVYTVHIPEKNVDVRASSIDLVAKAQIARAPMVSTAWFCCRCAKTHTFATPVRPPAPCDCGGIAFEKRAAGQI